MRNGSRLPTSTLNGTGSITRTRKKSKSITRTIWLGRHVASWLMLALLWPSWPGLVNAAELITSDLCIYGGTAARVATGVGGARGGGSAGLFGGLEKLFGWASRGRAAARPRRTKS